MDITYRPNKGGPDFGYDATVTHPIVANVTHKQAATVGRATEQAEKRKILKYGNICSLSNIAFVPIVYEVGGRPGELWTKEFKRLCGMQFPSILVYAYFGCPTNWYGKCNSS